MNLIIDTISKHCVVSHVTWKIAKAPSSFPWRHFVVGVWFGERPQRAPRSD